MRSLLTTYRDIALSTLDFFEKNNKVPDILRQDTKKPLSMVVAFCKRRALRYSSKSDWCRIESCSFNRASELDILDECCLHMNKNSQPYEKTKEQCLASSKKYGSVKQWERHYPTHVRTAKNKGWLDECVKQMKPRLRWSESACIREAAKYRNRTEWRSHSNGSYLAASRMDILSKCIHLQ